MQNENATVEPQLTPTEQEIAMELAWARQLGFSDIKYFWKDTERRFLGVSQSFLDYYGFDSDEALLGKTDEQMGWHIANNKFKFDEEDVIYDGKRIVNVSGKCLIKGILHEIYTNKKPIYRDGKIIGLFGFFVDAESIGVNANSQKRIIIDRVTGLCNARGLVESYSYFDEEYYTANKNVFAIGIQTDGYVTHKINYGDRAGGDYLKAVTKVLLKHYHTKAIIGRLQSNKFMLLTKYTDPTQLRSDLKLLEEDLCKITEAAGNPCSCVPYIVVYDAAKTSAFEEAMGTFYATTNRENVVVLKQIIDILGAEYNGILYLNLDTLEVDHYKNSGIFGNVAMKDYKTFWEVYSNYVMENASERTRDAWLAMGSLEGIRKYLSDQKFFERRYTNSEGREVVIRLAKLEKADEDATHILWMIRK